MSKYLLGGAAIGGLACLHLTPVLTARWLALPGYAFVLTLGVVFIVGLAGLLRPQLAPHWQPLAIKQLERLANSLRAPISVALGLGAVAAVHALIASPGFGTSAAVALLCLVISLSFAGFAMNLRQLASAWRARQLPFV